MFPIEKFRLLKTPFYYYDMHLLDKTLECVIQECKTSYLKDICVHYAVKANANQNILKMIARKGFGADCVSGGEIKTALKAGFSSDKIVFAGVGKNDWEIELGVRENIACFNVESVPELLNINEIASRLGRKARVALRINPNVDAHTHANITTGLPENKFGISMDDMVETIKIIDQLSFVSYVGLHFHIGSQILDMSCYQLLCERINQIQDQLESVGIRTESINVGGGLGIDYLYPDKHPIPDFKSYFDTFRQFLRLRPWQELHCELGRSLVGQCGSLISRILYVKKSHVKQFLILDAGFTDLIRPALYGAYHQIENLSRSFAAEVQNNNVYDVVGPICESSDVFGCDVRLPESERGDLIALRSAGAYGEVMASCYNCRLLPESYTSDSI